MRHALIAGLVLLGAPVVATAQVSIGISIGAYPRFDVVPGYPVYYATDVDSNFFFFDGLYWVFQGDGWYSSSWYDGPWDVVDRMYVPIYLLQVPVRYYRRPPVFFGAWQSDRAPHWGDHWGRDWDQRRSGWERPRERMAPAPLPDYQRQYRGDSYPRGEQQRTLRDQNYHYRPQAVSDRSRNNRDRPQRGDSSTQRTDMQRPDVPRPDVRRAAPQRQDAPRQGAQQQQREQKQPEPRQREQHSREQQRDDKRAQDKQRL
ncbi:MAG: hypothetical protein RL684_1080 [Pseudomonadota bacterium]|jgi:hypothetical protein